MIKGVAKKKVKVTWTTSDGMVFERETDAEHHERELTATAIIEDMLVMSIETYTKSDLPYIVEFIIGNKNDLEEIFDYIDNGEKTPLQP